MGGTPGPSTDPALKGTPAEVFADHLLYRPCECGPLPDRWGKDPQRDLPMVRVEILRRLERLALPGGFGEGNELAFALIVHVPALPGPAGEFAYPSHS